MGKDRIHWIDVARGIGILLVIYAHVLDKYSLRYLFYAFHMPLFFFISGIVHHHKKEESFWIFLKKTFRRIMVPYFFFAALTYGIWFLTIRKNPLTLHDFFTHMYGVLYGSSVNNYLFFNVILWFLPCLFLTKILFELLTRAANNKNTLAGLLGVFSLIGYFFSLYFPKIKLPLGLEIALTAVVFFGIGYFMYMYREKIVPVITHHSWLILFITLPTLFIPAVINYFLYGYQIDMRLNHLNNYFLFYIAALSGILICTTVSIMIKKNRVLEYLGRNSIILFAFHQFSFSYVTKLLQLFIPLERIVALRNLYMAPLYTLLSTVFICTGIIILEQIKKTKAFIFLRDEKR